MKKLLLTFVAAALAIGVVGLPAAQAAPKEKKPAAKKDAKKKRCPVEIFKKLDKNNDGNLTLDELAGKRDKAKVEKAFKRLDKNADGKVSLEEFKARRQKKGAKKGGNAKCCPAKKECPQKKECPKKEAK